MKFMNNHYGQSRIFGGKRINLQLFSEDGGGEEGTESTEGQEGEESKESQGEENQEGKLLSQEEVNKLIEGRIAREREKYKKEIQKEINEAKKLEQMSAQQKLEYERDKYAKELADYKREAALSKMSTTARKILSDKNINIPDELLTMLVHEDADTTMSAVDGFVEVFTEAVEKAVKERLRGETPKKNVGGGVATMTKEQILAIPDTAERQKKMVEHKEMFGI